ncbi:hypothetical protein M2322_003178 [Rhodoblastus acidophilus]|uniref:hypothetical protein n=1 Tax=Rhodoblastus acidophilus TaxID=1074 RepID=UPI002225A33C|nr:hypothetical protein [Rhodoblastus acidophilus]MCW2317614.1 hypothetical protein [Rhodoblastus acidophilus]
MATSKRKQLFLTRAEIFAGAWRRFRSQHGEKATPKQNPSSWRCCLRLMWAAAKGDACWLMAFRDDARREAAKDASPRRSRTGRRSHSRSELRLIAVVAA